LFVVYCLLFSPSADENPQPFELIELIEPLEPYKSLKPAMRFKPYKKSRLPKAPGFLNMC
jgi:hypothetical protein